MTDVFDAPTTKLPTTPAEPAAAAGGDVPQLATDVELIGLFEDSGFKEPPCIARRSDGQIVQLAPLLFALAEQVDGKRDVDQIAEAFSERIERGVDAAMVQELLDEQLRPLGIVQLAEGHTGQLSKLDPLLALRFRARVLPARLVHSITTVFKPLFAPPVLALALLAFAALDVWLFGVHGISQGLRHVLYQPTWLLALLGGVVLATAFHEIGHASAVRYGGARPGVMGVGIYIVWPAFYTDITDAYRLGKWGRLRADTGGMYFNALFALAIGGAYALTGLEPLLLLIVLQNFAIIQQSLPFLRLDGYYIISDLTGVPDMFSRIKPVLRSLIPGRPADERVTELKPWVRWVVTAYVLTVIPVLGLAILLMVVHAPRAFATAYDSVALHYQHAGPAFRDGKTLAGVMDVVQMLVLVLPGAGLIYTVVKLGRQAGPAAWRWSSGSAWKRPVLAMATAGAAAGLAFLWWPHDSYRPIQPGERGTLVSAVRSLRDVPSGHAALTPTRARELQGAPLRSKRTTTSRERSGGSTEEGSGGGSHVRTAPETVTEPGTVTPEEDTTAETEEPTVTEEAPPATTTPTPTTTTPAPTTTTPTQTTPTQTTPTRPRQPPPHEPIPQTPTARLPRHPRAGRGCGHRRGRRRRGSRPGLLGNRDQHQGQLLGLPADLRDPQGRGRHRRQRERGRRLRELHRLPDRGDLDPDPADPGLADDLHADEHRAGAQRELHAVRHARDGVPVRGRHRHEAEVHARRATGDRRHPQAARAPAQVGPLGARDPKPGRRADGPALRGARHRARRRRAEAEAEARASRAVGDHAGRGAAGPDHGDDRDDRTTGDDRDHAAAGDHHRAADHDRDHAAGDDHHDDAVIRRSLALATAVTVLAAAGCGGSDGPADLADRAGRNIGKVRSGELHLRFTLDAGPGSTVGVDVAGPFSLSSSRPLPALDVRYTQLAGTKSTSASLISTGTDAYLRTTSGVTKLTAEQVAPLRAVVGGESGTGLSLDLGSWLRDASRTDGPEIEGQATDRIDGAMDAGKAISDLVAAGRGAPGGAAAVQEIDRLRDSVSRARMSVLAGRSDHLLRRLRATITFSLPEPLRSQTKGRDQLTADFTLVIGRPNRPIAVPAAPSGR